MLNEETRQYIQAHVHEDVRTLALRGCKVEGVDFRFALQQIEGRQKARTKLPDFFENPDILYPATISMEQCSSTATAQYKASLVEGDTFADLTGGFGIDTFALSRRFKHGYHVEPNQALSELVQHNAEALNIENLTFIQSTMEEALEHLPTVDCFYIDPSRRDMYGNRVVQPNECTPNIAAWKSQLLKKCNTLIVKLSPMIDIKISQIQLPETYAIHTVAVNGECKEVLFLLQNNPSESGTTYHTVNLQSIPQHYEFTAKEEQHALPVLTDQIEQYLYEPNAAVLKAGAFKSIATHFDIKKLHPHTHLYTNSILHEDFPGRIFEINTLIPYNKKEIKQALQNITKANIATRNFPITAEKLKKELKLKDGGDQYLFGTTLANGRLVLLLAHKIR